MNILVLKQEEMEQVFTMKDAIQACKDALESYSQKNVTIPLRANLSIADQAGQSLYMYGYVPAASALGVKIVSVYPKNIEKGLNSVPASMILVDAATGMVSCLMDGTYLTRLRTGAVAGAATDILARKDSKKFALFGGGGQAESQLEAVLTVRDLKQVSIFDLSYERACQLAEKMSGKFGTKIEIKAAKTPEEALQDADIITSVTTSSKAVFDGRLVKANAHINAMGSYTPQMAEIDEYIIGRADKILVDTSDAIKESGDLIQVINKNRLDINQIHELGQVILKQVAGRESDNEMTFFESTGSAVLDLVTGQRIYQAAMAHGIGRKIDL